MMIVVDKTDSFVLSGAGDVIEPDEDALSIGSGAPYALACALGLLEKTDLSAKEIAEFSMKTAARICIYTNENIIIEEL